MLGLFVPGEFIANGAKVFAHDGVRFRLWCRLRRFFYPGPQGPLLGWKPVDLLEDVSDAVSFKAECLAYGGESKCAAEFCTVEDKESK